MCVVVHRTFGCPLVALSRSENLIVGTFDLGAKGADIRNFTSDSFRMILSLSNFVFLKSDPSDHKSHHGVFEN